VTTRTKTIAALLTALALGWGTTTACAAGPPPRPWGSGPPPHGPPIGPTPDEIRQLGLSDAQKQSLSEWRDEERRQVIRIEADLRIAHLDLDRLLAAERVDARAIDAEVDRISTLRAAIFKTHVATVVRLNERLTADQRKRLKRMREDRGPEGGGRAPER
jgi:Spy/CpxP family protein refolding chaperone